MNISKLHHSELLKKFSQLESLLKNDDNKAALSILEDIKLQATKKEYGLVFENHHEEIQDLLKNNKLSLKEEADLFISHGKFSENPVNFLIEGDNLASLSLLEKEFSGKIDMIYIDPPYNIGKKYFRYNDDYDARDNEKDEFSHSKWASFMEKRLIIARNLLKESASIFISINWKEQATTKFLCDKIFGEENFLTCITWNSNPDGDDVDVFETTVQYIFVYSKNKSKIANFGKWEKQNAVNYNLEDESGKFKIGRPLEKTGYNETPHSHPEFAYSIYYNPDSEEIKCIFDYNLEKISKDWTAEIVYEKEDEELLKSGFKCIRPPLTWEGEPGRWRLDAEAFSFSKKDFLFKKDNDNNWHIFEKERFRNFKFKKATDFISADLARQNSDELIEIFGKKVFDSPKPLALIEYLIQCGIFSANPVSSNPNVNEKDENEYLVLDFFAGSGTTGHAVLNLNKKDGGKRKFILCTSNENNISREVTYQRLKTVITGIRPDGTTYSDGFNSSLKYLKVDSK